jgi:hypothetical protein
VLPVSLLQFRRIAHVDHLLPFAISSHLDRIETCGCGGVELDVVDGGKWNAIFE